MSSGKVIAIKRINKDMKEITKSPVEGIGIVSLDGDPMKYVVNIRIMSGIYEGYCVQLLLTFTDTFPTKPPKILIFPGQAISGTYHHHIFQDYSKDENGMPFKKFCFDLLDNDFMNINAEHTGWNPSYTISCLLLQVQNFLSDPDMPQSHLPKDYQIKELMDSMNNYKRQFKIQTDNGEETKTHTWKDPYPEMYFRKESNNNKKGQHNKKDKKEELRMQQIKENLTCFMLKLNYIDDPDILLGYPIVQCIGLGKNKIELYPIPELLTYDGYMAQIGKQDNKLDFYFDTHFKSANNQYYNYWVPIYIDKHHYEKNKTAILNSFSIIKYGPLGIKEYDFKPEQIFEVLPIILNKMIIGIYNGKSNISSAFITCYFQYVLLFKKLCIEFEEDYLKYINNLLNLIAKNKYDVAKSIIPDIGNFLMLLFFSTKDTHTPKMKKMWYCLFEEFLTREMYWLFYGYENKTKMKNMILKNINTTLKDKKNEDYFCMKNYESIPDFTMTKLKLFIEDLNKKGIFYDIVNIIKSDSKFLEENDEDGEYQSYAERDIKRRMNRNFKNLFNQCSYDSRRKIVALIMKNLNFSKYFNSETYHSLYDLNLDELLGKNIKDLDKILEYAFKSQKGNSLLIITFFAQKKIEEKGFLEELEKNYGIYLDVDNFIKEMNLKLKEINSFKKMFEYIGSEFGSNMDDLKIIIEGYQRARKKGYIRRDNINFEIQRNRGGNNIRGSYRGRGGRGGRGRNRGRGGY